MVIALLDCIQNLQYCFDELSFQVLFNNPFIFLNVFVLCSNRQTCAGVLIIASTNLMSNSFPKSVNGFPLVSKESLFRIFIF